MSLGLVLFAHGARDPAWAAPFEAVAALVRRRHPAWQVRTAYLELMSPSLPQAIEALVASGCRRIDIRPMFLGTGAHVRNDLPQLVQALRQTHPGVDFVLHEAIGEHPAVHAAMAEAIGAAATAAPGAPAAPAAIGARH